MSRHLAVSVLTVFIAMLASSAWAMGAKPKVADEASNTRIQPVARLKLAAAGGAAAGNRTGEQVYKSVCAACHDAGAAGAPKPGDKAAWAARLGLGLDGLTASVVKGKGAMPPKGGFSGTDEELARAVAYLANQSGAGFKAK